MRSGPAVGVPGAAAGPGTGAMPGPVLAVILALVAAGIALRLFGLTHESLRLDELLTWNRARLSGLDAIMANVGEDARSFLYPWIMHLWLSAFGDSEVAMRLPTALASSAALIVMVAWLREAAGWRVALLTAVLLAFSSVAIRFGQDARDYGFVQLCAAAALACGWYAFLDPRPRSRRALWLWSFAFGLVAGAALHFHYFMVFTVVAIGLVALVVALQQRDGSAIARLLAAALLVTLIFVGWLPVMLDQLANPQGAPEWLDRYWQGRSLGGLLIGPLRFFANDSTVLIYPWWALAVAAMAVTALPPVRRAWQRRAVLRPGDPPAAVRGRLVGLLAVAALLAPVATLALSFAGYPSFYWRYFMANIMPFQALVALGLVLGLALPLRLDLPLALGRRGQPLAIGVAAAVAGLLVTYNLLAERAMWRRVYKDQYREAVAHIVAHHGPGHGDGQGGGAQPLILFCGRYGVAVPDYYLARHPGGWRTDAVACRAADLPAAVAALSGPERPSAVILVHETTLPPNLLGWVRRRWPRGEPVMRFKNLDIYSFRPSAPPS